MKAFQEKGFSIEVLQMKNKIELLQELGEDWKKNFDIIKETAKGNEAMFQSIKHLYKKGNQGNMMKIGLTLLAFPLPIVIDDVLGCSFLAAGLIQRKIKNSAIYLEDVNKTFSNTLKQLQQINQE